MLGLKFYHVSERGQWSTHFIQNHRWPEKLRKKTVLSEHIEAETNGGHVPDDIFKWIFLNIDVWISINISLRFVPRGPIDNIPALVQIMAWCRRGDKPLSPLSEPIMVCLLKHICVTRPQWVNSRRCSPDGLASLGVRQLHLPWWPNSGPYM